MKKIVPKHFLILCFLHGVSVSALYGQNVDTIIANCLNVIGGRNKIDSLNNYYVEFHGILDERKIYGKYYNARPYYIRYEVVDSISNAVTCIGFDGKDGWMSDSRLGNTNFKPHEKFPGVRNRGLHSQNFINYLIDVSKNGFVVNFVGMQTVDSVMCYKLKLLSHDRDLEVECYIDALQFILKKEIYSDLSIPINDPKKIITELSYLKFTRINGILFPTHIRSITFTSRSKLIAESFFSNYKLNSVLEDNVFQCFDLKSHR